MAAVAVLLLVGASPDAQSARPNVILIQADDLGYGDLGVYGQTKFQTLRLATPSFAATPIYRDGQPYATDPDRDYANDLFTREALDVIRRDDSRPSFLYRNHTVPHAELRVPDESLQPTQPAVVRRIETYLKTARTESPEWPLK